MELLGHKALLVSGVKKANRALRENPVLRDWLDHKGPEVLKVLGAPKVIGENQGRKDRKG